MAEHSARAAKGLAGRRGQPDLPPGRAGLPAAVEIRRHEAAKLLPARVDNITFNSVISDDGVMLTQARLEILPGDKRLLSLTLPAEAPISGSPLSTTTASGPGASGGNILIPLEQQANGGQAGDGGSLLQLPGGPGGQPRARPGDGRAEIRSAAGKHHLADFPERQMAGQTLRGRAPIPEQRKSCRAHGGGGRAILSAKAKTTCGRRGRRKRSNFWPWATIRSRMAIRNRPAAPSKPPSASRPHDAAFNEDARVQLHNIKLQQALIGLQRPPIRRRRRPRRAGRQTARLAQPQGTELHPAGRKRYN